jgi:hypothetical protein
MAVARVLLASALVAGLAACGSSAGPAPRPAASATATRGASDLSAAEPVTRAESAAIRGWSTRLRHGQVAAAARWFALPAFVANGSPPLVVRTRAQARAFNGALPCGAKVVRLQRTEHHLVLATFRLTERPGPGRCGTGTGALAQTAFRIRGGRIAEWLRVPTAAESGEGGTRS